MIVNKDILIFAPLSKNEVMVYNFILFERLHQKRFYAPNK